jgi:Ca2+-transporting ATPase
MRAPGTSWLRNEVTRNPYVWGALLLCVGILLGAVYQPGVARVLQVHPLERRAWLLVGGMSLVPWLVGQIALTLRARPR